MFARTNLDILVQVKCKAVVEKPTLSTTEGWKKLHKTFQAWYQLLNGIIPYFKRRLAGRIVEHTTNVCKCCLVMGMLYLTEKLVVKFFSIPSEFCKCLIFILHKNGVIFLLLLKWNWYFLFWNTSDKKKHLQTFSNLWVDTILLYDIAVTICHFSWNEESFKNVTKFCDQSP